jgi:hypothetical protein
LLVLLDGPDVGMSFAAFIMTARRPRRLEALLADAPWPSRNRSRR